jgi:Zn-dependent protease
VLLAEPPSTAYDLRFRILGISVRVTPFFWVAAAVLGWDLALGLDQEVSRAGPVSPEYAPLINSNPGQGILLAIWVAAVFVSVLVHELGHALVMRYYGIDSYIVLYHFGGLAVPDHPGMFARSRGFASPGQQIAISAAGPVAQLLLAAILILALILSGSAILFDVPFFGRWLPVTDGQQIPSMPLQTAVYFLICPSIVWALLNLLPVYPLDGGQIARELFTGFNVRDGIRNSLILSVATGVGVALYAFLQNDIFLAMFFAMLAYSSYQILQAYSGRGGFGGPW